MHNVLKFLMIALFAQSTLNISSAEAQVGVKDICVKAYSDAELEIAMKKCADLRASMDGNEFGPLKIRALGCARNFRGAGQGFESRECAVYDVVLKVAYKFTQAPPRAAAAPTRISKPVVRTPIPNANQETNPFIISESNGVACTKGSNGRYYQLFTESKKLVAFGGSVSGSYSSDYECYNDLPSKGIFKAPTMACLKASNGKFYPWDLKEETIVGAKTAAAGYSSHFECNNELP